MTDNARISKVGCLGDEDLYLYISGEGKPEKLKSLELHLACCADCRCNLAGLLEILHPHAERAEEETPAPSKAEVDKTVALIEEISRKERVKIKHPSFRLQWPIAAAAAIAFVALSFWGLKNFYEIKKSGAYFSQAEVILNQNYAGVSPSNLRLDLPFHSAAKNRGEASPESFRQAEILFSQALAYRENMIDAHLGLACIYLRESKAVLARAEFQKVLAIKKGHIQALIGRGIAQYEEAIQGADPLKRNRLLDGALGDFGAALKLAPNSSEALYNRIWALYESGLHAEALQEIERYHSKDSSSIWAETLKGLKVKIRATKMSAVEEDVRGFARDRNQAALIELARKAPYQMPAAIISAMSQSLESEHNPSLPGNPNSEDLRWAASILESAYREVSGDTGFKALPEFYVGLSPPQRILKRSLDKKLKALDNLYRNGQFAPILSESPSLLSQYTSLQDFWQVADVHHLRGNSYYLGKEDFKAAEDEYRKMFDAANRLNALALEAKAIGSLAMIYGVQGNFYDGLQYAGRLKSLAQAHNMKSMELYACLIMGKFFCDIKQYERSIPEYAIALEAAYQVIDGLYIVEMLENLGHVMNQLGRSQDAMAFYRSSLKQQEDFLANRVMEPMPELVNHRLYLLFSQGDLAFRSGDVAAAETFYNESLKSMPSGKRDLEGLLRLGLAEINLYRDQFSEAESAVNAVIALNRSSKYPEIEWRARSLKGRLLGKTGRHNEAMASLGLAIDVLEGLHRRLNREDLRQSFFNDRFDPFKSMVSLLYESSGDHKCTLQFIDRAKSLTLREYLRLPELTTKSPGSPMGGVPGMPISPAIEYFFTGNKLLIFFTKGASIEAVSQDISKKKLTLQVREFLESIRQQDANKFNGLARTLYDELIVPVEKNIASDSSETLMILPDGPLHLLPFAGLQDRQGRFLIEKMPVAYAPSRSVLRHCLVSGGKKAAGRLRATLIDGSASLPNAQKELAFISQIFGKDASILSSGNQSVFKQAAAASEIVHFSGHAINVQGKPALLLRSFPKELLLDCREIGAWRMPRAYFVNLAGCSTATGPLSEGESPWGLIPAFLNAGAPAVIASLMPVDDASTELLNRRFYELLQKGVGKAAALQKAQIALLNSARTGSDSNPQSWMPYILVGNPQ